MKKSKSPWGNPPARLRPTRRPAENSPPPKTGPPPKRKPEHNRPHPIPPWVHPMNTAPEPILIKCPCRNCDGPLEFEASAAGQTVSCPHCEVDTLLYIPGNKKLLPTPIAPLPPSRLRPCPDCGRALSPSAHTCPNCGYVTRLKPTRIGTIFLVFILLFITGLVLSLLRSEERRVGK